MEAHFLKKLMRNAFSFEGIPQDSSVMRYPFANTSVNYKPHRPKNCFNYDSQICDLIATSKHQAKINSSIAGCEFGSNLFLIPPNPHLR